MDVEDLKTKLFSLVNSNIETEDIDFKKELRISDRLDKAEFIRDILSLANPFDRSNRDIAFLIIGAKNSILFDISHLNIDDSDIRTIVASFIAPFLSVQYLQVDNEEGGKLGVVLIERDGSWHIVKRQLRSNDNRELYLTPGETYSRDGSRKYQLDGDLIVRILGEETQRKLAEIVSPMSERIRNLESEVEGLKNDLKGTRPSLSIFFALSNNLSKEHSAKLCNPPMQYTRDDLGLEDLLISLDQMGPNIPKSKATLVSNPSLTKTAVLQTKLKPFFEKKRVSVTMEGIEIARLLKEVFAVEKNPDLFQCNDVTVIEKLAIDPLKRSSEENYTYDGKDVERYEIVRKIQTVITQAQEWISYQKESCKLFYLPLAIQNNGRAPASDIVVEITSIQEAEFVDPFSTPKIPSWFEFNVFKDIDSFPIDRMWMIRPDYQSKATYPIEKYTHIIREYRGGLLHRAIDRTTGTYYCKTEIVGGSSETKFWRYRLESEIPHHENMLLAECLIIKPSRKGEFLLNFTIRAREIPDPVKETLILKID